MKMQLEENQFQAKPPRLTPCLSSEEATLAPIYLSPFLKRSLHTGLQAHAAPKKPAKVESKG